METFKRGDRVEVIVRYDYAEVGMVGTILSDDQSQSDGYKIKFDKHMNGHGCDGLCEIGYGQYVPFEHLKLIDSPCRIKRKRIILRTDN